MKSMFFFLTVLLWTAVITAQDATERFYAGTFTSEGAQGIYLCSFDPSSGEIQVDQTFKGIDNPNFLRISSNRKFLYSVSRAPKAVDPDGGSVLAFQINADGSLVFLNKQSSHGEDPCYVDVTADGLFVAVANYGGGSVALYPVREDGSLDAASSVIRHSGSGPNKSRQSRAFAHSIQFSAQNDMVYAADLGADKLFLYKLDKSAKKLVPFSEPFVSLPPGSGPRHFEMTSGHDFCYVVNELLSTVTVFRMDGERFTEIQTISALPPGFTGTSYCADIHLPPDEKFLYVSNRGHQSVAVFQRESGGRLTARQFVPVEGDWPRNFAIDPSGKFMLVANQRSHNITVFRLENGIPVFTGKELKIPAPVCIEFF